MKYVLLLALLSSCYLGREVSYYSKKGNEIEFHSDYWSIPTNSINDIEIVVRTGSEYKNFFYHISSNEISISVDIKNSSKNNITKIESLSDLKIILEYDSINVEKNITQFCQNYKKNKNGKYILRNASGGVDYILNNEENYQKKIRYGFEKNIIDYISFDSRIELKYLPEELNVTILIKGKKYKFKNLKKNVQYGMYFYHI